MKSAVNGMNKTGWLPKRALHICIAMLAVCAISTGCSSKARNLTLAFGGLSFAPDAAGFNELLTSMRTMNADEQKHQLKAFCDSSAAPALKHKASYVLARALQKTGTPPELRDAIARYADATQVAPLWERCQWHTSECGIALGDEKVVRLALTSIAERSKSKDARIAAKYGLGQSYMRTGEHENAQSQFADIRTTAPDSQFALGSDYYIAEMQIAAADSATAAKPDGDASESGGAARSTAGSGHVQPMSNTDAGGTKIATAGGIGAAAAAPAAAVAVLRHYLSASPDGRFARDIINQLQNMSGFTATKDDHNVFARVYYAQSDWRNALDEWHKAGNTSEWFKQAMCMSHMGRSNDAQRQLTAGIQNHPADEAVIPAANTLAKMTNRNGAIAVWTMVLQRCPKFADTALYNLATRASSDAASLAMYRRIVSAYPNSANAPESAWWVAWNDIKTGHSQVALAELQSASARYPDAKGAARFLYWIGKLDERLGQKAQAKTAYAKTITAFPWHYYAHRSAARLEALNGGKDRGWSTNPQRKVRWTQDSADDWQFPEPPKELASQEGPTIAVLTELKQWDECLELLPEKTGLLRAFYLAKLDLPLDAINAAGHAMKGQPAPSEPWQIAYPLLYAKTISNEAPIKHVDPLLVQALIREESRYNVRALSGSQAIGLMQLMPGTAYGVAKRIGIRLGSAEDIHNPDNNLRMGIDYLSYVLKRFNGNALFAVASYNGGPNAVQHWAAHMPADTDVFVENIPFRETRDYVRKVFGSYWDYEQVYAGRQL